jgi:HAUS augmin-like complex subunit 1
MAHLPPNAAIFSPSVARAAASAAKDWSYVDTWLQRKFPGRGPPPFERNADTLRVLLALASANEAADEERAFIARLEAEALEQLRAHEQSQDEAQTENTPDITLQSARGAILTSLESSLTRDGQTALTAMASLALQTNTPLPTPSTLGSELITLSTEAATLEQTITRIETLTAYLAREASFTAALACELRPPSPDPNHDHHDNPSEAEENSTLPTHQDKTQPSKTGYHPPPSLSLTNLTTQRRIKTLLTTRLPELRDKVAALSKSLNNKVPSPTIAQVRQEEEAYLSLLAQKKELDAQVKAFQGLPPDTEQARQELENLRRELRRMVVRRDEVFEGLVERETPRKGGGGGGRR